MKLSIFLLAVLCLLSCSEKKDLLSTYKLADDGVEMTIVAKEPMIIAPVAIDFDTDGRMWVAEMSDYMPDINGEKENIPAGRIVILEDIDGDGIMDKSKVFLDKIHHLRTIKLYRDGILYADNPNLYFAQIKDDKAINTTIVDSAYALGGNIEHKPNGLLMNPDNCIYSAKSHVRYCFEDEKWTKEPTNFRGQWGITQDENGRLYSNDNSNFFFGDQFLPNTVINNQFLHKPKSLNIDLVGDRSLYPVHSTAINRGYSEGTLDSAGFVKNTTSACGPFINQSSALGSAYVGNAFVCAPEANVVKRLRLNYNKFLPSASFYYKNEEFISSTDEAFRPVNLATGPDGDLYLVDFHRGIIQHKIYMTKYLKEKIEERNLDQVMNYGRILRISKKGKVYKKIKHDFDKQDSLVSYLSRNNSWLRMKAHEKLVSFKIDDVNEDLLRLVEEGEKLEKIHALWILNARKSLDFNKIKNLQFEDPWVLANLFKVLSKAELANELKLEIINKYTDNPDPIVRNHLLTCMSPLYFSHPKEFSKVLEKLNDALASAKIAAFPSGTIITSEDSEIVAYNEKVHKDRPYYIHQLDYKRDQAAGYDLYNNYCASCHGFGGQGIADLAPPLEGGQLINSHTSIVPLIMINGLQDSVTIEGVRRTYTSVMPAFNLEAHEIQKISNYIYNAFRDDVANVSTKQVEALLDKYEDKVEMWREETLLGTDF